MDLSNLFILIFLVVFSLLLYRNILPALKKYDANFLIDNEFNKPQSFHKAPTSTAGGLVLFFSFLIIFFYLSLIKNTILFDLPNPVKYAFPWLLRRLPSITNNPLD